jgi:uncharacterized delta-60 repeat protein
MTSRWRAPAVAFAVMNALLLLVPRSALGAAGSLDRTFGGDGRVATDFSKQPDVARAVVIQPDGKIVAVGYTGRGEFAVARYGVGGRLDPTFGGDGKVITDFGPEVDWAWGVDLQADGKIVVVGSSGRRFGDVFALARYRPHGGLDRTFGGDGRVTTDIDTGTFDSAFAVALQPNRKIVVAGSSGSGGDTGANFALARYRQNGALDRSFGGDGVVITQFRRHVSDEATAVAIQSDGRIVAAGHSGSSFPEFALARYRPRGRLDRTFGKDGKVTTSFEPDSAWATGVAVEEGGAILTAGFSGSGAFVLARYRPHGLLDATFGHGGRVITKFGERAFAQANGLAVQADGRILLVGSVSSRSSTRIALTRYRSEGGIDRSFGHDGRVITSFPTRYVGAQGVAVQEDGKIVAVGFTPGAFALARYLAA